MGVIEKVSSELMTALDLLEKEKNINKEELLEALHSLINAYKNIITPGRCLLIFPKMEILLYIKKPW